jgi:hypothetical protein
MRPNCGGSMLRRELAHRFAPLPDLPISWQANALPGSFRPFRYLFRPGFNRLVTRLAKDLLAFHRQAELPLPQFAMANAP